MHDEIAQSLRDEQQVRAERDARTSHINFLPDNPGAWRKPPLFVIFAIVGEKAFWHHAKQFAPGDHQRAVINLPAATDRRADHHGGQRFAFPNDSANFLFDTLQQRILQMQVINRVGRKAELGKKD